VTGRPKHYYSIYQKMIVRGRDFTDIYDLVGIRVLVDDVRDCYAALGTVHASWSPVPGRFKDFIAMPKFNMYQSLHTTVIGPEGKPVELQIRTEEMHRRAEYGIAAHWKYKEGGMVATPVKGDDMAWLRQLLDWQREAADPGDFMDSLRYDLHSTEVFVFTPKGDVVSLPAGATPVDFAYAVHTEVGPPLHRGPGQRPARPAGVLAGQRRRGGGLHQQGRDGPPQPGLAAVRQEPAGPQQDQAVVRQGAPRGRGRERQGRPGPGRAQAGPAAAAAAGRRGAAERRQGPAPDRRDVAVRRDRRGPAVGAERRAEDHGRDGRQPRVPSRTSPSRDADQAAARTATGSGTTRHRRQGRVRHLGQAREVLHAVPRRRHRRLRHRGRGVSVTARLRQRRAAARDAGARSSVEWAPTAGSVFLVNIQVEALDRTRLLSTSPRAVRRHVNILSASVTTTARPRRRLPLLFEMGDPKHLGHVLNLVRAVQGVYDAYRVTS
jgi:GTP pyrophosphokinase